MKDNHRFASISSTRIPQGKERERGGANGISGTHQEEKGLHKHKGKAIMT